MNTQETHKNQGIQVISRAADILRLLSRNSGGLSLGQIAQQVELPRSTVQRIVSALSQEGFVTTSGEQAGIRLGAAIRTLAQSPAFDLKDHFRDLLERISQATAETVDLAVLEGGRMRFIDQIEGKQRLRTVSSIGETFPLTTTANGKAALAALSKASAEKLILQELAQTTDAVALDTLLGEIAGIRDGALAEDKDEHTEGISALGFALSGPGGEIAAVSIPVPSSRFGRIALDLKATLQQIRSTLGD